MPYYFISKSKKAVSLWSGCGVRRFLGAVLQWRAIIVLYLNNAELILVCRRNCGFHFFQTRNTWLMKRLSFQPPPIFVLIRWARCKKKNNYIICNTDSKVQCMHHSQNSPAKQNQNLHTSRRRLHCSILRVRVRLYWRKNDITSG